jgi:hypothetical protein
MYYLSYNGVKLIGSSPEILVTEKGVEGKASKSSGRRIIFRESHEFTTACPMPAGCTASLKEKKVTEAEKEKKPWEVSSRSDGRR